MTLFCLFYENDIMESAIVYDYLGHGGTHIFCHEIDFRKIFIRTQFVGNLSGARDP